MNSFERVMKCFNHEEADRVPVYPILSGVTRKLVDASYKEWSTDSKLCADALIMSAEKYDLDCIVSLIDLSVECEAWGQELIFPENEAAHPNYKNPVIKSIDDYKNIKQIPVANAKRMNMHIDVCKRLVEAKGGELPLIAFVFGPLGTLSMLRGQQDMYMDLYDDPDAVKAAAKEINKTLIEYCEKLLDTGINAIMVDTLFASGSIMSKDMWMDMEGDLVRELADRIRAKGGMVMIHNCGEKIYFDVQIETMKPNAISFLYPPDDCSSFSECKEKYGDKVTLIGCVNPATAAVGSDEEWEKECKANIDEMSKGGGFILATGCEYPANIGFERAESMVNIAKEYGKYN